MEGRERRIRAAVASAVFCALAVATLIGSDDWFPFAPMRQYAYAVDPDGRISRHRVEAIGSDGQPVKIRWSDIEMRPAELEGLLRPLDTREARLIELLEVFRSSRPDVPPTIGIRYVRTMTQLVDRRVTEPQEIELARVHAPVTLTDATPEATSSAWERFWFAPVPAARAEVFRRLAAAFVIVDLVLIHSFLLQHGSDDTDLYQPLLIGRVLPLPVPTDLVVLATAATVIGSAALVVAGRANRIVAVLLAAGYLQWLVIDFSYGKVDHDRFPLVLALFVLASVRPTALADHRPSGAAAWALRSIQVGVVSVYFLSAVAKVRYGGWLWANSATLTQALVRRGTDFGRGLLDVPAVLVASQWLAVLFEVASPLMLRRGRLGTAMVLVALGFHAVTWSMLTIGFYPQILCLAAFAPLERLVAGRRASSALDPAAPVRRVRNSLRRTSP